MNGAMEKPGAIQRRGGGRKHVDVRLPYRIVAGLVTGVTMAVLVMNPSLPSLDRLTFFAFSALLGAVAVVPGGRFGGSFACRLEDLQARQSQSTGIWDRR